MLEIGQPLHTYDYDKVEGNELTCRFAGDKENLKTLDGVERILHHTDLVIADKAENPVCIAGVMGGLNSEITDKTKSVLLEAAVFDSASVRRTSRRLGLRSEASGRYEKGINPARTEMAINRICQLLIEQGACTVAPGLLDEYPIKSEPQIINTTIDEINDYIGIKLSKNEMIDILESLHFSVAENNGKIRVTVPDFRMDLYGMPDLAEEVARVYGYSNIPITTPWSAVTKGIMSPSQEVLFKVTDILVENGLSQVVNYSFMDKNDLKKLNFPEDSSVYNAISIMNPISDEYPDMRTSLLPGLMHTLQYNLSKKNDQVAIFEYGHIYEPKRFPLDELPKEYSLISGLMCGGPAENGYPNDQREYDFFDIKAVMENVLSALSIRDYKIRRTNYPVFHPGVSAEFVKNDVILARFGELHPAVLDKWNIKRIVYGFTISLPDIMIFAGAATNYKKIPKFPSAERDLAVLVPEQLSNENIENIIRQAGNKHLEKLYLFDLYQGKQVPAGFKSMAYRLSFRASDRTLTDAEVDNWIETIVISLGKVNVVLRT